MRISSGGSPTDHDDHAEEYLSTTNVNVFLLHTATQCTHALTLSEVITSLSELTCFICLPGMPFKPESNSSSFSSLTASRVFRSHVRTYGDHRKLDVIGNEEYGTVRRTIARMLKQGCEGIPTRVDQCYEGWDFQKTIKCLGMTWNSEWSFWPQENSGEPRVGPFAW